MKRYLILTILFCLYLLPTYGTYYNSNTNNYNHYNGISNQQTIETRRIGYSTNYGHGFNKVTQTAPMYRGTTFGSTSYYRGTYTPSNYEAQLNQLDVYTPDYSEVDFNEANYRGGPRRAPGDHASGSETVTVDGYSATITWNVTADFLGWRLWTITYSDGTSETFWGTFNEAKAHAAEVAEAKAQEAAEKMADNPDDPFADPVGDCPYWMLFAFVGIYIIYKKYNSLRVKQQIC